MAGETDRVTDRSIVATNHMVSGERTILIVQKNTKTEQRFIVKNHETRKNKASQAFIDIREFWYNLGHLEEPIPTRHGTMVHREHSAKIILALLGEIQPGETMVTVDFLRELRTHLTRLGGAV